MANIKNGGSHHATPKLEKIESHVSKTKSSGNQERVFKNDKPGKTEGIENAELLQVVFSRRILDLSGLVGHGRYCHEMSLTITVRQWRKGAQWFKMDRDLAVEVISDTSNRENKSSGRQVTTITSYNLIFLNTNVNI
ncbi:hypothetical protein HYC85_000009 [Camellia sinensis]|uniref:Uncharacterized protein n=1 Tax=Camellia sinensis TaxID=4442 RepID=A0A7J7FPB4_CAMSI|nr:hypothetical protein HYC85_000009 [Camellia sinensis]